MKFHSTRIVFPALAALLFLGACTPAMPGPPTQAPVEVPDQPIQYRGDAGRQGVYEGPALGALEGVKWQRSFEGDAYFPIFAGGTLYIGTAGGELLALDPETGGQRWSFAAGDGPILAVAVDNGVVYFGAGERGFYAVDATSGGLSWSFEADSSVWSSSPLLMNGMAYFGSDRGTVYALDLAAHEPAWTSRVDGGVLSQLAGDSERVYVPTRNYLYALDARTGAELWSVWTLDKWNAPAAAGGTVYAGNGSRQFLALEAGTGRRQWVFTAPTVQWSEWSAPVVDGDRVYVGFSNNSMYALDRETGAQEWQLETEDWATTDPILAGGILYFGVGAHANLARSTDDRPFYAVEAATGKQAWTFPASGLVYSAATIGNGTLYFKTLDNTLYALH